MIAAPVFEFIRESHLSLPDWEEPVPVTLWRDEAGRIRVTGFTRSGGVCSVMPKDCPASGVWIAGRTDGGIAYVTTHGYSDRYIQRLEVKA